MFDLNKKALESILVETSKLGKKKIKPEGLVTIVNSMVEFMQFVKDNLPTQEETEAMKSGQIKIADILEKMESFIPIYEMKVIPQSEFIRLVNTETQLFVPKEHSQMITKLAQKHNKTNPNLKIVFVEQFEQAPKYGI